MKRQKSITTLIISLTLWVLIVPAKAQQVKISDNSNASMNANSLLELESTTKGLLPPRVVINSLTSVSPLTGTVPAGMLVYSSGGSVTDGYYTWSGSKWLPFATGVGSVNVVAKSATGSIAKNETFIAASGDITLTLPAVTSADDGLSITVKNVGAASQLVTVVGNGGATIDGSDSSFQTRWIGVSYVAYAGNWITKDRVSRPNDLFDVSETSSWTTIPEMLSYLGAHMSGPTVVRLGGETFTITSTQTIYLPYPITFEGLSYGTTSIAAGTGLTNSPMFVCESECHFKMIAFDATTLSNYGNNTNEDAIQLDSAGTYHEIKDCTFDHFNKAINATNSVSIWLFESDIENSVSAGVEIASNDASNMVEFLTSESSFGNCAIGINLKKGVKANISVQNGTFSCTTGQTGLNYVPATFTNTTSMFFTNNTWNNVGTFISGFDFTRSDGRDANMEIVNNAGLTNKNATCAISVVNSATTTTLTTANTWYKATWDNTKQSITTVNFLVASASTTPTVNRFTFLPTNSKNLYIILSGNIQVSNNNRNITVGIVKNGASGTQYGATTIRTGSSGQPFPFSFSIYIQNVAKNDYFEIWASSANSGDIITLQDMNIFVNAQ
jgi:hypothetical protein